MKPHVITLTLKCMDKQEKLIEVIGSVPYSEVDNMLFLSIPPESAINPDHVEALKAASLSSGKTFVIVPVGTEILQVVEKWEAKKD